MVEAKGIISPNTKDDGHRGKENQIDAELLCFTQTVIFNQWIDR